MEDIPEKNDNELGIPNTGMTDTAAVSVTIIEDSEVKSGERMSYGESAIFFASPAYILDQSTQLFHVFQQKNCSHF